MVNEKKEILSSTIKEFLDDNMKNNIGLKIATFESDRGNNLLFYVLREEDKIYNTYEEFVNVCERSLGLHLQGRFFEDQDMITKQFSHIAKVAGDYGYSSIFVSCKHNVFALIFVIGGNTEKLLKIADIAKKVADRNK